MLRKDAEQSRITPPDGGAPVTLSSPPTRLTHHQPGFFIMPTASRSSTIRVKPPTPAQETTITTRTWYQHELDTLRTMLNTCIGPKWGERPEERIDEIRASRYGYGKHIARELEINEHDTVADFGSGCGFVTHAACERAKHVHCLDLSPEFLEFTRNELGDFENTSFHHIGYASIPTIADGSIDKVFSTAVFIHFLYYDVLFCLIELNRILKPQGLLHFDILDADVINLHQTTALRNHLRIYKDSVRGDGYFLQPFSLTTLRNLAPQLGFELVSINHIKGADDVAEILLRKVGDPRLPDWLQRSLKERPTPASTKNPA